MASPQQPEARRSGRGGATPQDSRKQKAGEGLQGGAKEGRPHGTDKGRKGGGKGGAVPPEQQPEQEERRDA